MDRFAVLVDAGYFFAAGGEAVAGSPVSRRLVSLRSPAAAVAALRERSATLAETDKLLRVYWYDAMPGPRMSLEQSTLALLSGVKLRLGALNRAGEQKGVDSLIVADMIELSRNRAVADMVLVSGDEDLRIAVHIAQSFGIRVHLLAAGDITLNVSPTLQMEADSLDVLDAAWLRDVLAVATPEGPRPDAAAQPEDSSATVFDVEFFHAVAQRVATDIVNRADPTAVRQLKDWSDRTPGVPPEFDRPLIATVGTQLGRLLSGDEKRWVRELFLRQVRAAAAAAAAEGV